MFITGKVLLMEEHPYKDEYLKLFNVSLNDNISVFKVYGIKDIKPISNDLLFDFDSVFIHVEDNIFKTYKSDGNVKTGDLVYLLDSEIKEIVDSYG